MRRHVDGLLLGCVLALPTACGDETPSEADPACRSGVALDPRPAPSALLRGSVRVRDERDTSAPEGVPLDIARGRVTATFGLLSAVDTGTPAASLPLGEGCLGLTSRPTPAGQTTAAEVDRLSVEGTGLGRFEVPSLGGGRYAYTGAPLLSEAAPELAVEASGGDFPAFAASVPSVEALRLVEPDPTAPVPLPLAPLTVTWVPGDGDAVWIELTPVPRPGVPPSGGQVTCRVPDDGCHVVPEAAVVFLRSTEAERYVATVRRERVRLASAGDAEVLLEASSSWRFELSAETAP